MGLVLSKGHLEMDELESIDSKIQELKLSIVKMDQDYDKKRKFVVKMSIYSLLLVTMYAIAFKATHPKQLAFLMTSMVCAYVIFSAWRFFINMRRKKRIRRLGELERRLKKILEEFKKMSKFEKIKKFIDKYETPRGSIARETQVPVQRNVTERKQEPPKVSRGGEKLILTTPTIKRKKAPNYTEKHPDPCFRKNAVKDDMPRPFNLFLDKVLCMMLGSDENGKGVQNIKESPKKDIPQYFQERIFALICANCYKHNGFVNGSDYFVDSCSYYCKFCSYFNCNTRSRGFEENQGSADDIGRMLVSPENSPRGSPPPQEHVSVSNSLKDENDNETKKDIGQ